MKRVGVCLVLIVFSVLVLGSFASAFSFELRPWISDNLGIKNVMTGHVVDEACYDEEFYFENEEYCDESAWYESYAVPEEDESYMGYEDESYESEEFPEPYAPAVDYENYDCANEMKENGEYYNYGEQYVGSCYWCNDNGKWEDSCTIDQECVVDDFGEGQCVDVSWYESLWDEINGWVAGPSQEDNDLNNAYKSARDNVDSLVQKRNELERNSASEEELQQVQKDLENALEKERVFERMWKEANGDVGDSSGSDPSQIEEFEQLNVEAQGDEIYEDLNFEKANEEPVRKRTIVNDLNLSGDFGAPDAIDGAGNFIKGWSGKTASRWWNSLLEGIKSWAMGLNSGV
jgi:hypothetical protein